LQHAKDRALKEQNGMSMWISFSGDLLRHSELKDHIAIDLGNQILPLQNYNNIEVEKFILGFN
jgi:hypothetical protein